MFNQHLMTFSVLILWSIHGSLAAPSDFTYVAFGSGPDDLPFATFTESDLTDTISVVPIGVAPGVTTYLYNEVVGGVVTDTSDSQKTTYTTEFTRAGTIVASASGFVASMVNPLELGQSQNTEVTECHYTNSVSGECVQSNVLETNTFAGPAITGTLIEGPSPNGGMPQIKLNAGILTGMMMIGVSTLVGVCIIWI
ncbi:hypothetical protein BDP27DRAFT_1453781 [Rhodocollybia butyracea]|uniref:Uncharacterized protein n=1 Tax=Rhodocollybia butyracea TaxID=206335 RepID=A0A9P5P7M1_9AGAR|nr:hypothetical protein BDP27DRAFT_1453781 [Rhodocollybia butyracea]